MKNKNRYTIYFTDETNKKIEESMQKLDMKSKSEWVEDAAIFYSGYLAIADHSEYISKILKETVREEISSTEKKLARLLFKVAVELAKLQQMFAGLSEIDEESMKYLHLECVNEVKKINGIIDLEKLAKYKD